MTLDYELQKGTPVLKTAMDRFSLADAGFKCQVLRVPKRCYLQALIIEGSAPFKNDDDQMKIAIDNFLQGSIGDTHTAGRLLYDDVFMNVAGNSGSTYTQTRLTYDLMNEKFESEIGKIYISVQNETGDTSKITVRLKYTRRSM